MKKILLFFLCIALSVMVCSCGNSKPDTTKSDATDKSAAAEITEADETEAPEDTTAEDTVAATVGDTTAALSDIAISATVPDGWTKVEDSTLPLQYMKSTASFMVMQEVYFSSNSLDDVVVQAQSIFSDTFDNVEYIGDVTTLTIGGNDARQFTFTCEFSGFVMEYEYNYVKVGEDIYSVIFADLGDTFPALVPEFEQILGTVQFG